MAKKRRKQRSDKGKPRQSEVSEATRHKMSETRKRLYDEGKIKRRGHKQERYQNWGGI